MPGILTLLVIAILIILSLVMAYGELELESMVVEATIAIATLTGGAASTLIEDAAGIAAERELQVGFTKKVLQLEVTNPTGAARVVSVFAADPNVGGFERTLLTLVNVPALTTVTIGLNDVEKPWRKVQPDDLGGAALVPAQRWQTQLRANQDALPGAGCNVTARYYDSKYPY